MFGKKADHALNKGHIPVKIGCAFLIATSLGFTLMSCSDSQSNKAAQGQAVVKPQVKTVVLKPQSVAVTADLPGRTAASLVADVRPQVTGIVVSRNFKEGSEVKAGDVLYEIDPAPYQATYDSAVAALTKAQAAVPSAQAKVDRYTNLSKADAVSKQDYDDANATLLEAKADVEAEKAAVETAKINLAYTKVRAPITGRIDASSVTVGALVTAEQTTALATINALDPINVNVTQSSANLIKFRNAVRDGRLKTSGDKVSVHLTLEEGSKYTETGTLEFAAATVDETVGTFTVRAVFPNPDRLLLPGMYVRASIEEGVSENSFLVPQRAVTRNTKGNATAMFVGDDNKVHVREIAVDREIGNDWLVTRGIKDGERVIVEGLQRVKDGQDVEAVNVKIDEATGSVVQAEAESVPTNKQASLDVAPTVVRE